MAICLVVIVMCGCMAQSRKSDRVASERRAAKTCRNGSNLAYGSPTIFDLVSGLFLLLSGDSAQHPQ